ncbi:hypothetical protein HPB50_004883 [Hyalomma asiaticum]|uniref:Uncharacterized protein n=1 Tax=Hyalomma asiaticum TaxID=266040 RepID=A0ACB7SEM6_HYAAI|nr:hypothetical protein HPB50_004883 [Hyalomma asiaticum]
MGFHEVHGENVRLEQGGKVARRAESFCKAIVFSSRPIQVNERVVLRIVELSNGWSGALRLGFTAHDPITLQGTLPKYACPDLTNRPGNWAKALGERYAAENTLLHYYVNNTGEVFFGINGEEKGLFLNGVDTRGPLWALIDIYGNTTAIKMVGRQQTGWHDIPKTCCHEELTLKVNGHSHKIGHTSILCYIDKSDLVRETCQEAEQQLSPSSSPADIVSGMKVSRNLRDHIRFLI